MAINMLVMLLKGATRSEKEGLMALIGNVRELIKVDPSV